MEVQTTITTTTTEYDMNDMNDKTKTNTSTTTEGATDMTTLTPLAQNPSLPKIKTSLINRKAFGALMAWENYLTKFELATDLDEPLEDRHFPLVRTLSLHLLTELMETPTPLTPTNVEVVIAAAMMAVTNRYHSDTYYAPTQEDRDTRSLPQWNEFLTCWSDGDIDQNHPLYQYAGVDDMDELIESVLDVLDYLNYMNYTFTPETNMVGVVQMVLWAVVILIANPIPTDAEHDPECTMWESIDDHDIDNLLNRIRKFTDPNYVSPII